MTLATILDRSRSVAHRHLFQLRHRSWMEQLIATWRRTVFRLGPWLNGGVCAVDIVGAMGFGASMSHMAQVLCYCHQRGLIPHIRISNRLYAPGGRRGVDWSRDVFAFRQIERMGRSPWLVSKIQTNHDYPATGINALSRRECAALFRRSVQFDSRYDALCDDVLAELGGVPIIGVHYRGTDKVHEAPRAAYDAVLEQIEVARHRHPECQAIFIATDELDFLAYGRAEIKGIAVFAYTGTQTSQGGTAVHFSKGDHETKRTEAIVTMLALARCVALVRTPSHLSAWSCLLNPDLDVIMVGRPNDAHFHFPDAQIWRDAKSRAETASLPDDIAAT